MVNRVADYQNNDLEEAAVTAMAQYIYSKDGNLSLRLR